MPFVSVEWEAKERLCGAALHTLPSMASHANKADQWWSLGLETLAVAPADDETCLHVRQADAFARLDGRGAAAYLDVAQILAVAERHGCDAVHPGYGFLSESAAFAARCEDAGLVFVGPRPDTLARFGDKARARALAGQCGVPLLRGSAGAVDLAEARAFLGSLSGAAGPATRS